MAIGSIDGRVGLAYPDKIPGAAIVSPENQHVICGVIRGMLADKKQLIVYSSRPKYPMGNRAIIQPYRGQLAAFYPWEFLTVVTLSPQGNEYLNLGWQLSECSGTHTTIPFITANCAIITIIDEKGGIIYHNPRIQSPLREITWMELEGRKTVAARNKLENYIMRLRMESFGAIAPGRA